MDVESEVRVDVQAAETVQPGEAGWRHLIVSNQVPEIDVLLQALDLHRYFVSVVNSSLIGWEKPSCRIIKTSLAPCARLDRR
ncbi:hypothetical protein [Streptomyces sp. NPDC051554]|uniref:hypothetical protein n=1 Tax=Streptomyces sp. NPDC051554 TaxID=3365656 RepID=UPI00378D28E2